MTAKRRVRSGPQPAGFAATEVMVQIATSTSEPRTREERLRQVHEIHPGWFHEATETTPEVCRFCLDWSESA